MNSNKVILTVLFFMNAVTVFPHDSAANKILSEESFIAIVKKFHPVVKQAGILVGKANAELTLSRSGFDPSFYLNTNQKTFDGKNYYSYTNPELKIPTWYGIEIKAGLENNGGQYLNSEVTAGQTSYVGVSVPLGKNLLMDKRRAVLKQAKLAKEQSEADRLVIINDLLYEASVVYWNWVKEYQLYSVISNVVDINNQRFELVKIAFRQGDRPAIDTIEALAQLQSFQYQQSESLMRFKNAGVELSNFLWLENDAAYQLNENVIPENKWNEQDIPGQQIQLLEELLYTASLTHPKLKSYNYKLQMLDVEKKLKFQGLLPSINLRTNLLTKGYDVFKGFGKSGFYENNNKFGIEIGIPLRLSEGRGGYRLAKLKIEEANFDVLLKRREIENKVRYYYNELMGLQQQVGLYAAAYKNYQTLFRGEDVRFKAGESSLFLLNSRENKQLEALQKLLDLKTKYYKTRQGLLWAAGLLR